MKSLLLPVLLLTAGLAVAAPDTTGKWRVVYAGLPESRPKTVGSMILDLKVDGHTVSGSVIIGVWPGEAPISDGRIEDGHITFTATGHLGSTTGIPTCKFDVTIEGDEMHVTMSAVKNAGGPLPYGHLFNYIGARRSNKAINVV
jgi:hypothetical protein